MNPINAIIVTSLANTTGALLRRLRAPGCPWGIRPSCCWWLFIGLVTAAPVAVAQTDEAAEQLLRVNCRVLSFVGHVRGLSEAELLAGKTPSTPEIVELYYAVGTGDERRYRRLRQRANKLAPAFTYEGPSPFELFEKQQVDGVVQMRPVVSVQADDLPSSSIMVLSRSASGGYRHLLVDRSSQRVPPAHVLVVNLSEFPLAASAGSPPLVIDPLNSGSIPMRSLQGQRFDLKLALDEPEGWRRIYSLQSHRCGRRGHPRTGPSRRRQDG